MVSRFVILTLLLALLGMGLANWGCSRSTSPASGGGGVTPAPGGPSFTLTFPAHNTSMAFLFADAGTWTYHCIPSHQAAGMTGTVVVSAGGADSALVQVGVDGGGANAFAYTPSSVTIRPGGTVRWLNASTLTNHIVTRP